MSILIDNTINIAAFTSSCKLDLEQCDRLNTKLTELFCSPDPCRPWNEMEQVNQLSGCYGVEVLMDDLYSDEKPVAYYLNSGDTYNLTLIYNCVLRRFAIATFGDFIEHWESLKNIAIILKNIPIQWDEWVQDDGDAYFPIRMSLFENSYTIWYGDSSFDTDHRGLWSGVCLVPDMTDQEYLETVLDLYDQIEQQKY